MQCAFVLFFTLIVVVVTLVSASMSLYYGYKLDKVPFIISIISFIIALIAVGFLFYGLFH